jgi:Uncharacterized conserved protein (COG2071)
VDFQTSLAEALFVNWAVPPDALPCPPPPLTLDKTLRDGETYAFVTLVAFRQRGLRASALPWPRLSFPQCGLRLPVRDREGIASAWLLRELVPAWVVPLARAFGGQPASAAIFGGGETAGGGRSWNVFAGVPLVFAARPAAPAASTPRIGSWLETVAFFRERPRGYVVGRKLRRLQASHPRADAAPVAVEIERDDWLAVALPGVPRECWKRPHSAFVLDALRLQLAVETEREWTVTAQAPAPG